MQNTAERRLRSASRAHQTATAPALPLCRLLSAVAGWVTSADWQTTAPVHYVSFRDAARR